ncbi:MAG: YabP/YqfC family sporulation protein [Lachnospiraceae bacterium]|nr:sporulation protein [Lachnospiraceae bacterium]MDE5780614.1 YabP/YqfC family sporulation protein [Lachnospiraceae bacterium]MDE6253836.1 YabP/YqfC family sporulation protein [Lachnospiraceae bacterium]
MLMEAAASGLNLPKDVLLGASLMHLTGHYEATIENYKNIIEYSDTVLLISTKTGKIKITGENLEIEYFTGDDMKVKGILREITII